MHYDAIIVGGSYAGLSAAIQLARARRKVCVIDAGQPRNRFAEASHGFFGQDGSEPMAMIAHARTQLLAYPTVTVVDDEAISAHKDAEGHFVVGTKMNMTLTSSGLILAHGVQDVLPEIPGLAERWGASVLHCPYCHGFEVGGRQLGVLASQPLSSHHARLIQEWGPTTLFLNGQDEVDDATLGELHAAGITVESAPIERLEGSAPALSGIRLVDGRVIPIDALFISSRLQMGSLASQLGCELEEGPLGAIIRTDPIKTTTVPGVFAAGDIVRSAGNATLASADGVMAGFAMHRFLLFEAPR